MPPSSSVSVYAVIAASGVGEPWQSRLLLPLSDTNQNLTPTLDRPLTIIPEYKVLRKLADGDALIQDGDTIRATQARKLTSAFTLTLPSHTTAHRQSSWNTASSTWRKTRALTTCR